MSLAIDAVASSDGVAIVRIVPACFTNGLFDVSARWVVLQADSRIRAVAVLSATDDFSFGVTEQREGAVIAPKSVGLLKPFGIGLRGVVYDYGLQLLAHAETVIGAEGVLIGDTSFGGGARPTRPGCTA